MTDQDVIDFLERMAAEEPAPFLDPAPLARRARHRAARTLVVGAVGIVAAIAVLVAGIAEIRTERIPTGQPATSVTSPLSPFSERFDSPLHGVSISYPSGWRTRAAIKPWGHDALAFGAPDVDVIFDPKFEADLYLATVSEPLGGQSEGWVSDVHTDYSSLGICEDLGGGGGGDDTLDGNYGWFENCDNDSVAIIQTATRGYIIYLHVGDAVPADYPVPDFEGAAFEKAPEVGGPTGLLETLDLRPEDAIDTLNPSESA
jgi:hypothetical protein